MKATYLQNNHGQPERQCKQANQNIAKCLLWYSIVEKINCTIPLKPLVCAPLRTESDISVTAAKSTLDPAVLNCRQHVDSFVSAESTISDN